MDLHFSISTLQRGLCSFMSYDLCLQYLTLYFEDDEPFLIPIAEFLGPYPPYTATVPMFLLFYMVRLSLPLLDV